MKKLLFLASNPKGTPNLEINDEIRQARNSLRRSEFEIDTRQAVSFGKNAFEEELSSTASNHRGMKVVIGSPTTDDSAVQILKKDLPLVPFEDDSTSKSALTPSIPSSINRQKVLRWIVLGGVTVIGINLLLTILPTKIQTPTILLSPTIPSSPTETLSTPDLIIRYYPQKDVVAVKSALNSLNPQKIQIGISQQPQVPHTNAIWFGSRVDIKDVKLVGETLLKKYSYSIYTVICKSRF